MSQSFEEGCDNIWPRSEYILACILHHLDNFIYTILFKSESILTAVLFTSTVSIFHNVKYLWVGRSFISHGR